MATYYLSPTGNDTTGDGSISSPYFTLEKVWDYVGEGDIVYMRGGTYEYLKTQWLTGVSGTSGNPISVLNYPGEVPIIQPGTGWTYDGWYYGILFQSMDYLHIKGLRVRNFKYQQTSPCRAIMAQHVNNSIFENLACYDSEMGMMLTGNSGGNLILNCDFYDNYDPYSPIAYGNADGLDVSTIGNSYTNTVQYCRAWNNSDDGFDFWASEGIVYVDGCWSWHNGYREDGTTEGGDGNGFKLGQVTETTATTRRYVYNCIGALNRENNFSHNVVDPQVLTCEVYNCFSYGAVEYVGYQFNWGAQAATNSILRNNISYNDIASYYGDTWITNDHNSWNGGYTVTSADFVSTDPAQLAYSRQSDGSLPIITFAHLAPGSDLIGTGVDVGLTYDGEGNEWNTVPSLGAYEYLPIYYVSNDGDDGNPGTIDYPWETLSKVNSTTFSPGDTILFRRGDTFRGSLYKSENGSSGNYITYGAYGTGNKPKILGAKDLSSTGDWELHSGNVWKTTATLGTNQNDISNIVFNNEESVGQKRNSLAGCDAQGRFFYNTTDNLLYLYSTSNPATFYSHIEACGHYDINQGLLKWYSSSYITIQDLDIRYSSAAGIEVGETSYFIIERCDVSWIGGEWYDSGTGIRLGNGISMINNVSNGIVRYNYVKECYDAGISPQGWTAGYVQSDIDQYKNIIVNCYYSYEGYGAATGSSMIRVNFYNNTCVNAGSCWSNTSNQRPDNTNSRHVMIWKEDGTHTDCNIKNNIFTGTCVTAIRINEDDSYAIKHIFDNNCYNVSAIASTYEGIWTTLSQWQTNESQDANGISADPLFVSSSDFHLQSSSPCIDEGVDVGLPYSGLFPDMGALEYDGVSIPSTIFYKVGIL